MKLELLNQMKGRDQIPFHLAEIDQWTELHKKKKYLKVKYSCPNSTLFSHLPLIPSSSSGAFQQRECSHPLLASEYLSIFAGSRTYIGQVVNFFP